MRVVHPFHPLLGREFDLVVRKKNWAEDRVFFFGDDGRLSSLPAGWTDIDPPDPFLVVAAGRSWFRVDDLVFLAHLVEQLRGEGVAEGVKRTMP